MKILHTSDWHLGKRLEHFSRLKEQQQVLEEICSIADNEKVDAVVVAGDLFDTYNPPTEAVDLFYKTLKKLASDGHRPVIAIAGNHDSPDRIESPDPLARECGIVFLGYPNSVVPNFALDTGLKVKRSEPGFVEIQLPGNEAPLRLIHTSYANEFRLKKYLGHEDEEQQLREILSNSWQMLAEKHCNDKGVNILVSHLFFVKEGTEKLEEPEDEKPILHVGGAQAIYSSNVPAQVQYVALGHLHRKQEVDKIPCPVMYAGSPVSYSFAEANQQKYVLLVEVEPGQEATIKETELLSGKKLLRYKADSVDDAAKWLTENPKCLVELTIVSDTYLTANDRKMLHKMHEGIVTIIPEIKNKELLTNNCSTIDLSKNIDELFRDYFFKAKGQEPNERIMQLFNEIKSGEGQA